MEFRPAELSDLVRVYPLMSMRHWKGTAAQIASFPAFTLWNEGAPRAICSLVPVHSGIFEACLMLPRQPRPTLSELRCLMLRAASVLPDRIVITRIHDANPAGRKLATLIGFVPVDEVLPGTRIRTWVRLKVTADQRA